MSSTPLPLYYLGDSHVRYLKKARRFGLLSPHPLSGVEVGGATAVGMRNPNATTNALGRFRTWIQEKPRDAIVVLHLGEVDCGFVIWYRAAKYEESIEQQMSQSIASYAGFIDELLGMGFAKIIITGATLPTITDTDQSGEVVVKRSGISATQQERTALTLQYNRALRAEAEARGLPYVDIDEDVLDPVTGVVDTRMRNPNPLDHHMHGSIAAALWSRRLHETIATYQTISMNRSTWTCTKRTYMKAYPAHSRTMPSDMRRRLEIGDIITGEAVRTKGEYTIVRNAQVSGESVPLLRLLHTDHVTFVRSDPPESRWRLVARRVIGAVRRNRSAGSLVSRG